MGKLKKIAAVIRKKPLVSIIIGAVVIIAVLAIILVSSKTVFKGHVTGTGLVLEDGYWMTNDNGVRFYQREGYTSTAGIDVSQWVEDINFKTIKNQGIEFVIIRVGLRGYVTGKFDLDQNLAKYLKDAKNAGLDMGVYFVSQAVNEREAKEEAEYVMEQIKGYDLAMPIYIDLESVYEPDEMVRTDGLTKSDYTKIAIAFCNTVEEAGYRGGIYANEQWFTENLDFNQIRKYDIWLAKYANKINTKLAVNMWQYSGDNYLDGTDLPVDMNVRVERETAEAADN